MKNGSKKCLYFCSVYKSFSHFDLFSFFVFVKTWMVRTGPHYESRCVNIHNNRSLHN